MRSSSTLTMKVPLKVKAGGYAFPFCKELKVKSNTASMLQLIHTKHNGKCDPTTKEMREAAVQHDQYAQDNGQIFELE